MTAFARPATALTTGGVLVLSAAFAAAPPTLSAAPSLAPVMRVDMQQVALAGFIADIYNQIQPIVAGAVDTVAATIGAVPIVGPPIADQIDILYTYTQQAVGGTVYLADDLVTPLVQGQFWPVSGAPGNYLAGAINSATVWAGDLVNTAIGFVQAEIDYFGGIVPNVFQDVINVIQNVINWITGWIPGPFAATSPAAAAVSRTAAAPAVRRAAARTAAASRQSGAVRSAASLGKTVRGAAAAKSSVHRGAKSAAARSGR